MQTYLLSNKLMTTLIFHISRSRSVRCALRRLLSDLLCAASRRIHLANLAGCRLEASAGLILALCCCLTAGCSTPGNRVILEPGAQAQPGSGIVFGRLQLEKPVSRSTFFNTRHYAIRVCDQNTLSQVFGQSVDGTGGPFYWTLNPGRYVIVDLVGSSYSALTSVTRTGTRRVFAEFSIDAPGETVYLGTLKLSADAEGVHKVSDEGAAAIPEFRARHPLVTDRIVTRLIQLEKPR